MSDVWLGRINRWIEKLFNVKGGPTVVDIHPAVQPVIDVQSGVEDRYLQGWNRYAGVALAGAVAAQFSAGRLRNPPGSGIIAVIESITAVQAVATTKSFLVLQVGSGPGVPDLGTVAVPLRLDARNTNAASMHLTAGQSTVNGPLVDQVTTGGTARWILTTNEELTLLPGDSYEIQDGTANEALNVSFVWRERVLESSESN